MKEETQKTLGELYAIRATMSLIAQNDDNAIPERRAIDEIKGEIEECKTASRNAESRVRSNLREYELNTHIEQLEAERDKVNKSLNYKCEAYNVTVY